MRTLYSLIFVAKNYRWIRSALTSPKEETNACVGENDYSTELHLVDVFLLRWILREDFCYRTFIFIIK